MDLITDIVQVSLLCKSTLPCWYVAEFCC